MSKVADAIREHHRELIQTLKKQTQALAEDWPDADPEALLKFLKGDLLPHATGEERHMYPLLDQLIAQHGRPTFTMTIDHRDIEEYVRKIEQATEKLASVSESERVVIEEQLRRLALQLEAVVAIHLRKEEDAFLPLFEKYLTETDQQHVLDGMHEAYSELDVRRLPHPRRHSLIFATFANLGPGESFVLINDHDPKPLYFQLKAERDGTFTWEYEEQGPAVWRVRIGKVA